MFFPPCIKGLMEGVKSDGRKRALFILLNFLTGVGYDTNSIEKIISEWGKKLSTIKRGLYTIPNKLA